MLRAGAAIVFVTERDSLSGAYSSEGILQGADPLTSSPVLTPRPSFYAVRSLSAELAQHGTSVSNLRLVSGLRNASQVWLRKAVRTSIHTKARPADVKR